MVFDYVVEFNFFCCVMKVELLDVEIEVKLVYVWCDYCDEQVLYCLIMVYMCLVILMVFKFCCYGVLMNDLI